jgi:hypothetical protein
VQAGRDRILGGGQGTKVMVLPLFLGLGGEELGEEGVGEEQGGEVEPARLPRAVSFTDHTDPCSPSRHETSPGSIQREKFSGSLRLKESLHDLATIARSGSILPGMDRRQRYAEPRWGCSANQWPSNLARSVAEKVSLKRSRWTSSSPLRYLQRNSAAIEISKVGACVGDDALAICVGEFSRFRFVASVISNDRGERTEAE